MHNHIELQAETTPASGRAWHAPSLPARLRLAAARLRNGDSRQV